MAVLLAIVSADPRAADLEVDVSLWVERKVETEDVADGERGDNLEDAREDALSDELDAKLDDKREERLEDEPEEEAEFAGLDEVPLVVVDGQPREAGRLALTAPQSLEVDARASILTLA